MDGIIVINKPKGYTSHDVVAKVKKILNIKKVGHTGTLDPNATGVLPLLLNDGTKLSKYLIEHDKEYEVVLKLGIKTDTADVEGNVVKEDNFKLGSITEEKMSEVLKSFIGIQEQIPPMYSAIKVKGKKLYEYARSGETIEVKPRKIEIYNIELLGVSNNENELSFRVECSKGTYIRSLCEDIAEKIGTLGYMKELKRTKVGTFNINSSIGLEELEKNKDDIDFLQKSIISIEDFFKENEKIQLNNKDLRLYINGVKLKTNKQDGIYNVYNNDKYIGIATVSKNELKREIVVK